MDAVVPSSAGKSGVRKPHTAFGYQRTEGLEQAEIFDTVKFLAERG